MRRRKGNRDWAKKIFEGRRDKMGWGWTDKIRLGGGSDRTGGTGLYVDLDVTAILTHF
jgi:hypothetical protein